MNLKLAKRIRQGMREMAQVTTGGAIRGNYPDDYEGEIQRKGAKWLTAIFHHDYICTRSRGLYATETTSEDGTTSYTPHRVAIRLKLASARQVYKRAKRMVGG